MSDFTKEELQDLHKVYKAFCSSGEPVGLITLEKSILRKLQAMIADKEKQEQCEHDWRYQNSDYQCTKCGLYGLV